jgi:hypothetical protein
MTRLAYKKNNATEDTGTFLVEDTGKRHGDVSRGDMGTFPLSH